MIVILNTYVMLALQYCRLGYTGKALSCLQSGERFTKKETCSNESLVKWHLAYIEYQVSMGDIDEAAKHFKEATSLAGDDPKSMVALPSRGRTEVKIALNRVIAEASYSMSLLSFEKVFLFSTSPQYGIF